MEKLPQAEYDKAIGQFRLQLNGVLEPFRKYGLAEFIPGAIKEIVQLTEDFGLRVRGVDKPISLDYIRRRK